MKYVLRTSIRPTNYHIDPGTHRFVCTGFEVRDNEDDEPTEGGLPHQILYVELTCMEQEFKGALLRKAFRLQYAPAKSLMFNLLKAIRPDLYDDDVEELEEGTELDDEDYLNYPVMIEVINEPGRTDPTKVYPGLAQGNPFSVYEKPKKPAKKSKPPVIEAEEEEEEEAAPPPKKRPAAKKAATKKTAAEDEDDPFADD